METGVTSRREALAERVAERLDRPVTIAGVVLVAVLVVDNLTPRDTVLAAVLAVVGWVLWALFVVEFVARLVIAPSTARFLRRNWWQLVFLAVPFLRFMRALSRGSRVARATSTSVRGTRTAGRRLAGQLGWLAGITIGTILIASELLFTYGDVGYAEALHAVTLSAVSGEPLEQRSVLADVLEVVLAVHSVVIFATLAGVLGAFFLERMRTERNNDGDGGSHGATRRGTGAPAERGG